MIPERVFHQILALGDAWRLTTVDYLASERELKIQIEEAPQLWAKERCPHCCGQQVLGYEHARTGRWRHLNMCQLESEIVCALPRGQSKECRKVYTVRAPWEGRSPHCTQEFECLCADVGDNFPSCAPKAQPSRIKAASTTTRIPPTAATPSPPRFTRRPAARRRLATR